MATSPRERLDRQLDHLEAAVADGLIDAETAERFRDLVDILDVGKPNREATDIDGEVFKCKPNTLEIYLRNLRVMAESGVDFVAGGPGSVNAYMAGRHDRNELQANSLITYQAPARAFYCAFEELGFDPRDVDTYSPDKTPKHDQQDLYAEAEVFAMRAAVGRTQSPVRNRAFLELLIFTLQRLTALLTLRVKDVDAENGYIYLNEDFDTEHGGLKNALDRGRERPVYGARKYLLDHVRSIPDREADDWLFKGDPSHPATDPDGHWSEQAAREFLDRLGGRTDLDKPTNPHAFRHYGITVLRWDYGIRWDEINAQAGVVRGSDMPRTTYNHIDDADLRRRIEESMGLKDERQNRFAPVVCPVCSEVQQADWRKCPNCNERFAPGDDDGSEELEWLEDKAAMDLNAFKRAVALAVERELEQRGHVDSS